jgi:hypothetical protein
LPAIPVKIRHTNARAKLLQVDRNPFVTLEMDKLDPCQLRHIHKFNRETLFALRVNGTRRCQQNTGQQNRGRRETLRFLEFKSSGYGVTHGLFILQGVLL